MIVPLGNELRRAAHSSDHRSAELDRALAQRSSGSTRHQIAAELRRRQQDMYLYTDVVPTLVLAALWLLLPYEASAELRIGGCVLLVAGALSTRIVRTRSPLSWSNFAFVASRVVLALILAFLLPSMWYAAVICIAIMVVGFVPMESPRRIIALTVVATAATSAIAIFRSVPLWYLANAAQLVSVITTTIWFHQWSEGQNEIDRLHNEVIDRARMFSWEVDVSTGEILSIAGNVEAVLGFTAGQLIGKHVRTIVFPDDRLSVLAEPSTDDSDLHAEVSVRHRDGHRVHLREVRHRSTTEGTIRGVSIDITELALAGEALRYQAEHDGLTGLANRTVIERSVSEASADPKTANVALVLADLDRFKEINDTLGHPTGDRVLCILANRFAEGLGAADVVARLGGDEFAVVARVDARAAIELADKLHGLATAPVAVDGLQLAVACSVGVAVAPDHGSGFPDLLKHADIATYQAKRAGGGVQLFESAPDELSITRLQLISEVPAALDREQFKLYLQPQVDLTTGQVVGVEGLARWLHPELGLLTPDSFLNAIEVASDYHRFTREMLRQAVDLAASIATVSRPLPVAVNLSSMSFLDKSLPGYIATLLRNRSLPGPSLTLEVTESDLLDEHRADAPVFAALKAIGVSLSLDDFGTGYSTLTRLRELDVDEVKVDQAFVAGLDGHSEDTIIVQAIVQLGQLLGHHVVAEGVETIDQLAVLRTLGCTTGQGHLFAPAMPEADFLSLLEARMSYTHLTARQSPAESLHHNGRPGNAAARQARE